MCSRLPGALTHFIALLLCARLDTDTHGCAAGGTCTEPHAAGSLRTLHRAVLILAQCQALASARHVVSGVAARRARGAGGGAHLRSTRGLRQWSATCRNQLASELPCEHMDLLARPGAGAREPTWRMVDGVSTESLALEVARTCALPPSILRRANSLYQARPITHTHSPAEASPSSPPQNLACASTARWTQHASSLLFMCGEQGRGCVMRALSLAQGRLAVPRALFPCPACCNVPLLSAIYRHRLLMLTGSAELCTLACAGFDAAPDRLATCSS